MQTTTFFTIPAIASIIDAAKLAPVCSDKGSYEPVICDASHITSEDRAQELIGDVLLVRKDRATARGLVAQNKASGFSQSCSHIMPSLKRFAATGSFYGNENAYMHGSCEPGKFRTIAKLGQAVETWLMQNAGADNFTVSSHALWRNAAPAAVALFDAAASHGGFARAWRAAPGADFFSHILRDLCACSCVILPVGNSIGRADSVYAISPAWRDALQAAYVARNAIPAEATEQAAEQAAAPAETAAKAPETPAKPRRRRQATSVA